MSEGQSIFDKAKDKAGEVKDKFAGMVGGQSDKVESGIDDTGDYVDERTGGRYSEHVDRGQEAASNAVEDFGDEEPEPRPDQDQGLL